LRISQYLINPFASSDVQALFISHIDQIHIHQISHPIQFRPVKWYGFNDTVTVPLTVFWVSPRKSLWCFSSQDLKTNLHEITFRTQFPSCSFQHCCHFIMLQVSLINGVFWLWLGSSGFQNQLFLLHWIIVSPTCVSTQ
jgi:hypothetical protein